LEITEMLVRTNAVDIVVIDSVAALIPEVEIKGEMGDQQVGLQARLMSKALRKIGGSVSNARTVVMFINQIREKVGVMFGNPETTPGGRALKFWSSVRIELRQRESIKRGSEVIGGRTSARIKKNKVAPPFRRAEFDIIFGTGISKEGCLLDVAEEYDIVERAGSWYSYGEERLGQGRENACEFLENNPDIALELENAVREEAGLPGLDMPDAEAGEEDTENQEDEQ
ncbi:MAG: DNA recombination/repair protein RecA, partial [Armatimonadota bacterium]